MEIYKKLRFDNQHRLEHNQAYQRGKMLAAMNSYSNNKSLNYKFVKINNRGSDRISTSMCHNEMWVILNSFLTQQLLIFEFTVFNVITFMSSYNQPTQVYNRRATIQMNPNDKLKSKIFWKRASLDIHPHKLKKLMVHQPGRLTLKYVVLPATFKHI